MEWLYNMLIDSGVESVPASWAVSAVVVILVYFIVRTFLKIFAD